MTRFISLSSGSSGNCYYIGNESTSILIDVGIGTRAIKKRLLEYDIPIESVSLILVTHDHFDHIKSVGTFAERYHKPVFTTETLHKALSRNFCTAGRLGGCIRIIQAGVENDIDGIKVTPFEVPHDATQTLGYFIDFFGEKFTIMTDLGKVTDDAVKYARLADHLIVESNYDVDMLITGNYPKALKERIMNGKGHLSNEQTTSLLRMAVHDTLRDVFLCHLSGNNNTPEAARRKSEATLRAIGSKASLHCLPRSAASELFEY